MAEAIAEAGKKIKKTRSLRSSAGHPLKFLEFDCFLSLHVKYCKFFLSKCSFKAKRTSECSGSECLFLDCSFRFGNLFSFSLYGFFFSTYFPTLICRYSPNIYLHIIWFCSQSLLCSCVSMEYDIPFCSIVTNWKIFERNEKENIWKNLHFATV